MKYIKTFEISKDRPHVGDYVLMSSISNNKNLCNFINNTIGKMSGIETHTRIFIKYKNIPPNLTTYFNNEKRGFELTQVMDFAKTREELEARIEATKYNL